MRHRVSWAGLVWPGQGLGKVEVDAEEVVVGVLEHSNMECEAGLELAVRRDPNLHPCPVQGCFHL